MVDVFGTIDESLGIVSSESMESTGNRRAAQASARVTGRAAYRQIR